MNFILFDIMRVESVYLSLDLFLSWACLAVIVYDCYSDIILVAENSKEYVKKLKKSEMCVINVSSIKSQNKFITISANAHYSTVIFYINGFLGAPKNILLKHENLRNWIELIDRFFNFAKKWCFSKRYQASILV